MKLCSLLVVVSMVLKSLALADALPLAETAKNVAANLVQGSIATAEVVDGNAVYAIAGKHEPEEVAPEKILFEIGSISKVFTALLLAQAVIEKEVTLDSTVRDLAGDGVKFADERVGAITLRQLVTHASGLPRLPDNMKPKSAKDPYVEYDRAKLNEYLAKAKLPDAKDIESEYSNLGVGLLGDLLSRHYHKSWEELVRERITAPLGMSDTVATLNADQEKRLAPPYAGKGKALSWHFQSLAGAGVLRSTLADMVLFGKALLEPSKTPFASAIELMLKPQRPDIGLAMDLGKVDGERYFGHNGGTGGYRTTFMVLPESKRIRAVFINNSAMDATVVLAQSRGEKPRTEDSGRVVTEAELAEYVGVYALGKKAKVTVLANGTQLMTQITGQSFFKNFPHEDKDRFFLKVVAAEHLFTREDGKVTGLSLFQNGRETKVKRLAEAPPVVKFHTAAELRPYAGRYEGEGPLKFTVIVRNETLFVKLDGQEFAPVFERRANWWEYDIVDAALEFEKDATGKVTAMTLHQNGQVLRVARKAK